MGLRIPAAHAPILARAGGSRRSRLTRSTGRATPDPAFSVAFAIDNHNYTGLKVDKLNMVGESQNWKMFKGYRNVARAGRVEVRWA